MHPRWGHGAPWAPDCKSVALSRRHPAPWLSSGFAGGFHPAMRGVWHRAARCYLRPMRQLAPLLFALLLLPSPARADPGGWVLEEWPSRLNPAWTDYEAWTAALNPVPGAGGVPVFPVLALRCEQGETRVFFNFGRVMAGESRDGPLPAGRGSGPGRRAGFRARRAALRAVDQRAFGALRQGAAGRRAAAHPGARRRAPSR